LPCSPSPSDTAPEASCQESNSKSNKKSPFLIFYHRYEQSATSSHHTTSVSWRSSQKTDIKKHVALGESLKAKNESTPCASSASRRPRITPRPSSPAARQDSRTEQSAVRVQRGGRKYRQREATQARRRRVASSLRVPFYANEAAIQFKAKQSNAMSSSSMQKHPQHSHASFRKV
jgi:hypothetical protein